MSQISPRTKRHIKPLTAGFGIIILLWVIMFCVIPEDVMDSQMVTGFTLAVSIVAVFLAMYSFTKPENWYPEDIRHIINNSDVDDWEFRERNWQEELIYRPNRGIKIIFDSVSRAMEYHEQWMDCYPNSNGTRYRAKIFKDGHELDYCYLVFVDGEILVPEPESRTGGAVSKLAYQVGWLLEVGRYRQLAPSREELEKRYERKLEIAGLEVQSS